jgi:hypothetical protein
MTGALRTSRGVRTRGSWPLRATALCCVALLAWGLAQRSDSDLTPRAGLGYALGIIGLGQMVLLLGYSLRKRLRWLRGVGRIQRWFELHMMLGLLAPTALLLHCNFALGSLNSSVALFCTLFVAGSGIGGRFLYVRIHRGLLGERRSLESERARLRAAKSALSQALEAAPPVRAALVAYEQLADSAVEGPLGVVHRFFSLPVRARRVRSAARSAFRRALPAQRRRRSHAALDEYMQSLRRAAAIASYEWLFGLWHAVHLPLSAILFGSAAIHVVAVHMY